MKVYGVDAESFKNFGLLLRDVEGLHELVKGKANVEKLIGALSVEATKKAEEEKTLRGISIEQRDFQIFKGAFENNGTQKDIKVLLEQKFASEKLSWKYQKEGLEDIYFSDDVRLRDCNFTNVNFQDITLHDISSLNTNFTNVKFINSAFKSSKFSNIEFKHSVLKDMSFEGIKSHDKELNIKFTASELSEDVRFEDCKITKFECDKDTKAKKIFFENVKLSDISIANKEAVEGLIAKK